MSAPVVLPRFNLTFRLARSVNIVNGVQVAQTIDIAITPLATPSTPSSDLTLVGGTQEQSVLLNNATNTATFALVPTNTPGLSEPLNYLCSMRQGGVTGRTTETTFAMPTQDADWDDLASLGALIDGVIFLQWTDLGVPGRVARLDDSGRVIDSSNAPVAMPGDIAGLDTALSAEIEDRIQGDAAVTQSLQNMVNGSATSTLNSAKSYTDDQVDILTAQIGNESGARANAITTLTGTVSGDVQELQAQITPNTTAIAALNAQMPTKADRDGSGWVPLNQTNPAAITKWIPVADTTAMHALTYPAQVQLGDVAYLTTGSPQRFVLVNTDPTLDASWMNITPVTSVAGKKGDVALTAADVGAVDAATGTVSMGQVTGLSTALLGKASTTDLTAAQSAITALQNDTTVVHTTSGAIASSVMPTNAAFIDADNNLTKKDGTILPIGSLSGVSRVNGQTGDVSVTPASIGAIATGAALPESQITGLVGDLAARVLSSDTRLTNARTPTAHAASHLTGGSDPITIGQAQVTGLSTSLLGKAAATDMTAAQTNITALQNAMPLKADLDGGGLVLVAQLPSFTGAAKLSDWATKADLSGTGNTVPLNQLPTNIPQTSVAGLPAALTAKADLSGPGGTVNPAQLPSSILSATYQVASQSAMLALAAHQGDIAVITTGASAGTYRLATPDPTQVGNWVKLIYASTVNTVNGQTGDVNITAASLGALDAATGTITMSQVNGLSTALGGYATSAQLSTATAGMQTAAQVQAMLSASTPNKQTANYVATTAIPSLSGQQTVDGVLTPLGSVVLATAQPSSINNGLWIVNSGAWTRTTDFATGSYLLRGSEVVVKQGSTFAQTLWQETANSGIIDTAPNNWVNIGSLSASTTYTGVDGVQLSGTQISAKAATGGGIKTVGGLALDPAVALRHVGGAIPSTGSVTVTINHGLNNLAPGWVIYDTASGRGVDLGPTVIDANNLSFEFATPPASGAYRYMIWG